MPNQSIDATISYNLSKVKPLSPTRSFEHEFLNKLAELSPDQEIQKGETHEDYIERIDKMGIDELLVVSKKPEVHIHNKRPDTRNDNGVKKRSKCRSKCRSKLRSKRRSKRRSKLRSKLRSKSRCRSKCKNRK